MASTRSAQFEVKLHADAHRARVTAAKPTVQTWFSERELGNLEASRQNRKRHINEIVRGHEVDRQNQQMLHRFTEIARRPAAVRNQPKKAAQPRRAKTFAERERDRENARLHARIVNAKPTVACRAKAKAMPNLARHAPASPTNAQSPVHDNVESFEQAAIFKQLPKSTRDGLVQIERELQRASKLPQPSRTADVRRRSVSPRNAQTSPAQRPPKLSPKRSPRSPAGAVLSPGRMPSVRAPRTPSTSSECDARGGAGTGALAEFGAAPWENLALAANGSPASVASYTEQRTPPKSVHEVGSLDGRSSSAAARSAQRSPLSLERSVHSMDRIVPGAEEPVVSHFSDGTARFGAEEHGASLGAIAEEHSPEGQAPSPQREALSPALSAAAGTAGATGAEPLGDAPEPLEASAEYDASFVSHASSPAKAANDTYGGDSQFELASDVCASTLESPAKELPLEGARDAAETWPDGASRTVQYEDDFDSDQD